MKKKLQYQVILFVLAFSAAIILWITLISRVGYNSRCFKPPFSAYNAVFKGSSEALPQVVCNVILFIPIGIGAALVLRLKTYQAVIIGLFFSLVIESCQWFLWLGTFECDDLLNNTLGTAAGVILVKRGGFEERIQFTASDRKKNAVVLIGLVVLLGLIPLSYQVKKMQTMARYASMNDREDGTRNLLILNADPQYIGQSDFHVTYLADGGVLIEGHSDNRSWITLGRVRLEKGRYIFEDMADVDDKTVAIVLDHHDVELNRGKRITEEVGPVSSSEFELTSDDVVRILVSIYPGAEGSYIARPAIYRLE